MFFDLDLARLFLFFLGQRGGNRAEIKVRDLRDGPFLESESSFDITSGVRSDIGSRWLIATVRVSSLKGPHQLVATAEHDGLSLEEELDKGPRIIRRHYLRRPAFVA